VLAALAQFLGKASGETVRPDDFQPDGLPEFLRMNFRVVDASGNEVAMGRDLGMIRRQLGLAARASFAENPPPEFHRDGITRWDFGDLPERAEIHHQGMTLNGYPALVDAGKAVNLRLFDSPDAAAEAMRGGLRKLFMIQLRKEFEYVDRTLPDMERLCLYYSTIGRCDDLRHNLLQAIADRALFGDEGVDVRSREEFARRAEAGWRRLSEAASEVTDLVAQSLDVYHALDIALSNDFPPLWHESIRDMRDQLRHLVYRGFVVQTPFERLRQLPRHLRGIDIRLKKLANAGLNRDTQALAEVLPLWDGYRHRAARHREEGIADPALDQYRWMLEELRISLFAQELKTITPVSVQRY
jgi:ATP-dependent helicase HrpA